MVEDNDVRTMRRGGLPDLLHFAGTYKKFCIGPGPVAGNRPGRYQPGRLGQLHEFMQFFIVTRILKIDMNENGPRPVPGNCVNRVNARTFSCQDETVLLKEALT